MRRNRGFTIIELAVVIAVIGILTATAAWVARSSYRNADVGAAGFELAMRLGGLRTKAMAEGVDYLLVVADAPGSDASSCNGKGSSPCTRYWVLKSPTATWSLSSFDPASPGDQATLVDAYVLPRRVHLDAANITTTSPAPFSTALFDSDLVATRGSTQKCFAIRYGATGQVQPERANSSTSTKKAFAFGLASDLNSERGADRRGVVVSFPTAIVRAFSY